MALPLQVLITLHKKIARVNSFSISSLAFVRDSPVVSHGVSELLQSFLCLLRLQIPSCFMRFYSNCRNNLQGSLYFMTKELSLGSMSHLGDGLLFSISHHYFSASLFCHVLQYTSMLFICFWNHYFCLWYFFSSLL